MREEERELSGKWFFPNVPELSEKKLKGHRLSHEYNLTFETDTERRKAILKDLLLSIGEGSGCLGPIHFHYGCHTKIGNNCYMNMNFTVQDDAYVTIGNDCRFGPNCTIVTPLHPLMAEERRTKAEQDGVRRFYCQAKPVTIGNDCWFGAGVTVCPGVTIGNGCVIGAGSVVTKDIPDNSLAYGVPCRVAKTITEADSVDIDAIIAERNADL